MREIGHRPRLASKAHIGGAPIRRSTRASSADGVAQRWVAQRCAIGRWSSGPVRHTERRGGYGSAAGLQKCHSGGDADALPVRVGDHYGVLTLLALVSDLPRHKRCSDAQREKPGHQISPESDKLAFFLSRRGESALQPTGSLAS